MVLKKLYNLGLRIYALAARLASPFKEKARLWVSGRKDWEASLEAAITPDTPWIWFHVASLGEFEQGRNLIEKIRSDYPHYRILLTFFSPSGYEIRKNYKQVDHVAYLPMDFPGQARRFLDIVNPSLVFFVKYDLWLNYLSEVQQRNIPAVLISASVTPQSKFLTSPLSRQYKKAFRSFTAIFTQDEASLSLLEKFTNHPQLISSSDTRFDRVSANKEGFQPIPEIEAFKKNRFCVLGGSTWVPGEDLLFTTFEELIHTQNVCMIVAPHEMDQQRMGRYVDRYPGTALRFSEISTLTPDHRILMIDNIGMLSQLYHYADVAYIGGGFRGKLHNILEAVAFGVPVFWGPKDQNRPEAADILKAGGGFSISNSEELKDKIEEWIQFPEKLATISQLNTDFVEKRTGATLQILSWCEENQYLQEVERLT